MVVLAESGTDGMVITDLPKKIPGLDACAACIAAKSVHLPHKEGRNRAEAYLDRVHIDITGPMPKKSAGGKEYEYIIVDDYSRAVYTRPLRLKSDAPEAFKKFKAAAENESQKRMREVMTDNARKLSMGESSASRKESSSICQYDIAQSQMGWLNVRLAYSPTPCVLCCAIRVFPGSYGQRRTTQRHTCTTGRRREC